MCFPFSFLDRVYPVAIIAMLIYLPTAADYSLVTWHGIPPTGKYSATSLQMEFLLHWTYFEPDPNNNVLRAINTLWCIMLTKR